MRVAGQRERNATWNERKHVGIVRHQDHGRPVVHGRSQRGWDVGPARPQVADAREPYWASGRTEFRRRFLEHPDAVSRDGCTHAIVVQP